MAQYKGLYVPSIVVSVRGSESECFLMDSGEIAEQIFGIFSFFIGIQFHLVNACKTKQGQLAVLVETGFCFELSVNEIGQEGQSQSLEQKLQVGLACGEQISGALPQMACSAERDFRCADGGFERLLVRISVLEAEVEDGTQGSGAVGGEGARIKCNLAYQVGIDNTYRSSGCTLSGKVVDVGDFDAIHIKAVFGRRTAPNNQVVAIADGRERDAGIGAYDARNIPVGSGTFLYFLQADDTHADRAFNISPEGGRHHHYCVQQIGILFHLYLDERG